MAWDYVYTDGYPGWSLYGPEQSNNAQLAMTRFAKSKRQTGMTKSAAAGIIGNFTWESGLNPGQWEHGYNQSPSSGFGLAQWTPSTKYTNWLGSTDPDEMSDGDNQIDFLLANNPNQWSTYFVDMNTGYSSYYNVTVPILPTIEDYYSSTDDPQTLAVAWMVYWERGNALYAHFDERKDYAQYWYDNLDFNAVPIWLLCKAAQEWRL